MTHVRDRSTDPTGQSHLVAGHPALRPGERGGMRRAGADAFPVCLGSGRAGAEARSARGRIPARLGVPGTRRARIVVRFPEPSVVAGAACTPVRPGRRAARRAVVRSRAGPREAAPNFGAAGAAWIRDHRRHRPRGGGRRAADAAFAPTARPTRRPRNREDRLLRRDRSRLPSRARPDARARPDERARPAGAPGRHRLRHRSQSRIDDRETTRIRSDATREAEAVLRYRTDKVKPLAGEDATP